jgi:hypothetical protein
MKVSLDIIRLSTKDGRTDTRRSKRSENRILTSTPQNRETVNPASIRNIPGKHLRIIQKGLIIFYSSDEEHEEIINAELSYHGNTYQFDKGPVNETGYSSEVDVAQENLFE